MNYSFPLLSIGCVGEPGVRLIDEGEVVITATETGEERLVGESIGAHSGEVTQPTESVGAKHVGDCNKFGWNGWLPSRAWQIGCDDVVKATHLEGFWSPGIADKGRLRLHF
jgi:hypothetical protein